jgi:hypothetical protein
MEKSSSITAMRERLHAATAAVEQVRNLVGFALTSGHMQLTFTCASLTRPLAGAQSKRAASDRRSCCTEAAQGRHGCSHYSGKHMNF